MGRFFMTLMTLLAVTDDVTSLLTQMISESKFIHTSTVNNPCKNGILDEGNYSTPKKPQELKIGTLDLLQIQDAGLEQWSKQDNHVAGDILTGWL